MVWRSGLDSSGSKQRLVAGSCGHGSGNSGSINGGESDWSTGGGVAQSV